MSALGIALLSIGLLLLGGGIGFYLARLGQSADSAKLEEVETEFDDYRRQVTEHFSQTAEQFHAIGQQYKDLYEHLASGSEALCQLDSNAEPPFPLVGRDDRADAKSAEAPDANATAKVSEEVLLAAAAVTTAATDEEVEPPVEITLEATELETEAEAVADESIAEADAQEPDVGDEEAVEIKAEAEADATGEDSDDDAPDNVVELKPRGESDDDGDNDDGERSVR